jgi:hypothetical protein
MLWPIRASTNWIFSYSFLPVFWTAVQTWCIISSWPLISHTLNLTSGICPLQWIRSLAVPQLILTPTKQSLPNNWTDLLGKTELRRRLNLLPHAHELINKQKRETSHSRARSPSRGNSNIMSSCHRNHRRRLIRRSRDVVRFRAPGRGSRRSHATASDGTSRSKCNSLTVPCRGQRRDDVRSWRSCLNIFFPRPSFLIIRHVTWQPCM